MTSEAKPSRRSDDEVEDCGHDHTDHYITAQATAGRVLADEIAWSLAEVARMGKTARIEALDVVDAYITSLNVIVGNIQMILDDDDEQEGEAHDPAA